MRRGLRGLISVVLIVALFAGIGLYVRHRGFGLIRISGASMNDTLKSGDIALVTRFDYRGAAPKLGEVVQCRFPGRSDVYVKRVMGLPGNRVSFKDGALTIDGTPISEPYVSSPSEDYEITLGDDQYLLLGDNRAESYDSRMQEMGPVGIGDILGKIRFIVWPIHRMGSVS